MIDALLPVPSNSLVTGFCVSFRPWAGVTDHLAVNIGTELLGIVPGRVSTEVDAHLSYDTQATIDKVSQLVLDMRMHRLETDLSYKGFSLLQALKIVDLYGKKNIDVSKQLYIKVWLSQIHTSA